jgi:ferric-dicitrate binding protein FerR (iron transport regulator)
MDKAIYTQLVIDNLQGLLSEDELDRLNEATLSHTALARERLRLEELWDATGNTRRVVTDQETLAMIDRIKNSGRSTTVRPLIPRLVAVAAMLFVLVSASIWILDERKTPSLYDTAGLHTLPDGSEVTLRSGAIISDIEFNKTARRLTSSGDVVFSVIKDRDRPFVVQASNSTTTVTGTIFMIRSGKGDLVSVSEGSVEVKANNGTELESLKAGDAVTVASTGNIYKLDHHGNLSGWRDGVYSYRDVTLQDIVNELAIIFDTQISIAQPEMRTCSMTAALRGVTIEEVLEVIRQTKGMQIKRRGNGYVMDGGTCG